MEREGEREKERERERGRKIIYYIKRLWHFCFKKAGIIKEIFTLLLWQCYKLRAQSIGRFGGSDLIAGMKRNRKRALSRRAEE